MVLSTTHWLKRKNYSVENWKSRLACIGGLITISLPALGQSVTGLPTETEIHRRPAGVEEIYKLDAGDKLRITVFGEPDLGGEYFVDGSGDVRLPLIGQIQVAGATLLEFERRAKAKLESGYLKNARVSAEVINYRPFYILGQVNKPGEYEFVNGLNVLTAIALAGGYTYRASEQNVFIRRKGSDKEEAAPANQATKVFPGDIIRVRERFF
jgi:protein involved in polysaccharide export with SLBB domain